MPPPTNARHLKPTPELCQTQLYPPNLQGRVHEARVAQVGETTDAWLALELLILLQRSVPRAEGKLLSAEGQ